MKTIFIAASLALSMAAATPALAAEDPAASGDAAKPASPAAATHTGTGKVVSVDAQAGTVRLTHDPIKSLKWPKMTMDFKASDPALLKDIKPGDQVEFKLMKTGGGYQIVSISASGN